MTDLEPILTLWQELRSAGSEYVLATVVNVEGSGYRKPGALMLVAKDGRKAGTISGGCLEGEVARKAFWHTEQGPVVRRYSTKAEDGDVPFGMGCGGVIFLLLERGATASVFLDRLAQAHEQRQALATATYLSGPNIGERAFWPDAFQGGENAALQESATRSYEEEQSFSRPATGGFGEFATVRAEFRAARPGLFVLGAGDDALPLVRLARQLGWYIVLGDGRAHLATKSRFPEAHEVHVLPVNGGVPLPTRATDAVAIMTHSLEQDTSFLRAMLPRELAYVGVLGPRRRTREILESLAEDASTSQAEALALSDRWLQEVHAPMGLDLGGTTPADIALSIVAEIQQTLQGGSGLALATIRARREAQLTCASAD